MKGFSFAQENELNHDILNRNVSIGLYTCYERVDMAMSSSKRHEVEINDNNDNPTSSRVPFDRFYKYWDNVLLLREKRPTSLSMLQAHWQYSAASTIIGTLLGSSVLGDNERSEMNEKVVYEELIQMVDERPESIQFLNLIDFQLHSDRSRDRTAT